MTTGGESNSRRDTLEGATEQGIKREKKRVKREEARGNKPRMRDVVAWLIVVRQLEK